ncbi:hypothetical protein NDU88_009976 [Pleurodeles waltl]|uniref:Uncharacterized protein n=1 Tax=Pleurodeles waltl TaxID=8319 RepID=A0AAV7RXN9_PLEWA|nr:hypothetical protein NDU88_009976 [Pleurodeles waltl]
MSPPIDRIKAVEELLNTARLLDERLKAPGEDNSLDDITRQRPMREMHPRPDPVNPNAFVSQYVRTHWQRSELLNIRKGLPDYWKNTSKFYEELEAASKLRVITFKDIEMFFGTLLPILIWRQIWDVDDVARYTATWNVLEGDDATRVAGDLLSQHLRDLPDHI